MEEQKAPRLTTPILESVMPELLEIIFSFLSVQDVASCCRVCQAWHDLVVGKPPHEDLSTLLWRQLLERDYPHVPASDTTPWLIQYQTLSTYVHYQHPISLMLFCHSRKLQMGRTQKYRNLFKDDARIWSFGRRQKIQNLEKWRHPNKSAPLYWPTLL